MDQDGLYELLRQVYKDWCDEQAKAGQKGSYSKFGVILGETCNPPRKAYTSAFVSMLLNRQVKVPADLVPVIERLGRVIDLPANAPQIQAEFTTVNIVTLNEVPPGASWSGKIRHCRTPGCPRVFLPYYGQQYCPWCRAERQAARAARQPHKQQQP